MPSVSPTGVAMIRIFAPGARVWIIEMSRSVSPPQLWQSRC